VGLERGPLSLVATVEELLERKSSGSGVESLQSRNQSHVTTDGQSVSQSVSVSWCRTLSGFHDQMFVTVWPLLLCLCGE
jgi:hypothetical protein